MSETALLLAIHDRAGPFLDLLFRFSHELGTLQFTAILAFGAIAWHGLRGERREALLWLAVGVTTLVLYLSLKPLIARPRPDLWPRLLAETGFAFPSGHALVSAAFYPLVAWATLRLRRTAFFVFALGLPLFVGFGRLYLGVHWPSDVLAGWALGAAQSAVAIRWLGRAVGRSGLAAPTWRSAAPPGSPPTGRGRC